MDLKALKEKVSILEAVRYLGLTVHPQNKLQCYNSSAHKNNDAHPSLSLDHNKNRYTCFSCKESGSIIDLVSGYKGITKLAAMQELCDKFLGNNKPPKEYTLGAIKSWQLSGKVFDELYDYGLYIKVRFRDPKDRKKQDLFFSRTSGDKFIKGRKCIPSLYNEKAMVVRSSDGVLYAEGESCVDSLESLGFLATTAGSATITLKTFTPEMLAKLKNRDVVVFPDNDQPGRDMFSCLTPLLAPVTKTLSLANVEAPWKDAFGEDMPVKADVKDFIEKFKKTHGPTGLKEAIDKMIDAARLIEAPTETSDSADLIKDKYFDNNRFVPQKVVLDIQKNHNFLYTDRQFYYYDDGFWKVVDTDFIAQIAKIKLGPLSTIARIKEVINDLKLSVLLPDAKKLNIRTDLINLRNGMYSFLQKKLLPHNHDYLSTIRINADFNPNAECPRWIQFLEETLQPDIVMILQEFFGHCLVADNRFEKSIILVGSGANGKSVTLSVLTALIGNSNVAKISLQDLGDRFKTVELYNRLVNIFADMGSQTLKDAGIFKMLTSGDPITAERKYEAPFSFTSFCRLIFSCNELPKSLDKGYAYYRRLIILPFKTCFTEDVQDKSLKSKLLNELDGILYWSLLGLHRLFSNQRFSASETANDLLDSYKLSNDNIIQFTAEACVFGDGYMTDKRTLYTAYKEFCDGNSLRPVSQRRFNAALLEKNVKVYETRNHFSNKRAWKGVALKEN